MDWLKKSAIPNFAFMAIEIDSIISIYLLDMTSSKNKKFWEDLITYFPLIRYGPHAKQHIQ
jgi:hypothetical protein